MLQISDEQLTERTRLDAMLMRHVITLDDCLDMCMALGVPASPYLRSRYYQAIELYKSGECEDLAEPFGIAMSRRQKKAQDRETFISHVRFMVDGEAEKGHPKTDPTKYDGTAFHSVGKILHKSPSQIFDIYYGKK